VTWWEDVHGDPCRECGTSWVVGFERAVEDVARVPWEFALVLPLAGPPTSGWSGTEYTVHVADTLRSWSERLVAALAGDAAVPAGHDADELAAARRYGSFGPGAALWAVRRATEEWCDVVREAHARGVAVRHARHGDLSAHDIALRNRHGALHHVGDVRRLAVP
jgi:hypothetical protein